MYLFCTTWIIPLYFLIENIQTVIIIKLII